MLLKNTISLRSPSLNEDNHNSLPTSCSSTVSVNIETVDSLAPLLNNPEQHLLSLSERVHIALKFIFLFLQTLSHWL